MPYYDTLVLTPYIKDFDVHKVLVDPANSTNLLQLPAFKKMKLSLGILNSVGQILSGFNGVTSVTLGDVALPIKVDPVTQQVLFSIFEDLGPYNGIIGRAWLHSMKAIPLTYHQTVIYLTNVGQVDFLSNQLAALQCYHLSVWEQRWKKSFESPPPPPPQRLNPRVAITVRCPDQGGRERSTSCVSLENVTLNGSEKFTYISSLLSNEEREQLQIMLLNNIYVFAWSLIYG